MIYSAHPSSPTFLLTTLRSNEDIAIRDVKFGSYFLLLLFKLHKGHLPKRRDLEQQDLLQE